MFTDLFPHVARHPIASKHIDCIIQDKGKLEQTINELRKEGKTIGWTNGVFDLLHVGHMLLLQQAAENCDILIVGINSDKSVSTHKPEKDGVKRPLLNETLRALSILSIKGVDHVFIFDNPTTEEYLKIIKPDAWFRGGSYEKDYGLKMEEHPEGKIVTKHGGKCIPLPMAGGYSTTEVIRRLRDL